MEAVAEIEVSSAPALAAQFGEIVEFDLVQAGLVELETRLRGRAYDVTSTSGNKEARADRAECVRLRTTADGIYTRWNKPVLARQRAMRDYLDGIKTRITAVEAPIDAQIKADEERRAAEREAREALERAAAALLQNKIDLIKRHALAGVGQNSATVAALLVQLAAVDITLDEYGERTGEAEQAQRETQAALQALDLAAEETEALRASLEAQRLEQEARESALRLAEARALEVQAARDAELRAQAEQQAAQAKAERLAAEQAARAAAQAEQERQEQLAAAKRAIDEAAHAAQQQVRNAAQALLEALRECLPFVDAYRATTGGDGDQAAAHARAVIYQATGETL